MAIGTTRIIESREDLFNSFIDQYRSQLQAVLAAGISEMCADEIADICERDPNQVRYALPGLVLAGIFAEIPGGKEAKYALTEAAKTALEK